MCGKVEGKGGRGGERVCGGVGGIKCEERGERERKVEGGVSV